MTSTNLLYTVTSNKPTISSVKPTLFTTFVNRTEICELLTFHLNNIII